MPDSRLTIALIILAVALALGGCASTNPWMRADKLFKDGQYAEAADAYAEAAEKYPQRREPLFNRGAALHMSKDFIGARKVFQALAKEADTQLQEKCEYNTGNGYLREGENEKAITHYKRALYLKPDDINAKWNLELARRRQQQQQQQDQQDQKRNKDQDKDEQQKNKQKDEKKQPPQAKQKKPRPKPQCGQLSKKEAERLLRALAEQDKQLQKQLRKPDEPLEAPSDKDW